MASTIISSALSLSNYLGDYEYIKINCPFGTHDDDTPSCCIYPDHVYCYGCGTYESAEHFLERIQNGSVNLQPRTVTGRKRDRSIRSDDSVNTLVTYWHYTLVNGPRNDRQSWFRERGFTDRYIRSLQFGHTGDHFVIPLWTNTGNQGPIRIAGFKWRIDPRFCDGNGPKYRNQSGLDTVIVRPNPGGFPLVICEGELDAYFLSTFGVDAVTSSSGAGSLATLCKHQTLFRSIRNADAFFLALDPDEAGLEATQDIQSLFPAARVLDWGIGDISDYLLQFEAEERFTKLKELFDEC